MGPHAHAVHGDALEGHEAGRHQGGDALGEQRVQKRAVGRAEIRQGVVVHGDASAEPLVGAVHRAEPVQRPGAPHPLYRGVQPQGQEEFRVGGRAPGLAVDRGDLLVERGQVQLLDVGPHAPGPVVFREEAL